MPIENHITDPATGNKAEIHEALNRGVPTVPEPRGLVVYQAPLKVLDSDIRPFTSPGGLTEMNINAGGVGTPEDIHDGGDNVYWTASALSGIWDFASTDQANTGTQSINGTATINGDEALFEDGTNISMSDYIGLKGAIYITGWSAVGTKGVEFQARLNGVDVGNTVNVSDYVLTGVQNVWQSFSIPKADMGLTSQTIDELSVETVDIGGGPAPDYYLDDLEWLGAPAGDTPVSFVIDSAETKNSFVTHLVFFMADAVTEAAALAYNTFLGLASLPNGVLLSRHSRGEVSFSESFHQLSDILRLGRPLTVTTGGDGTNRWLRLDMVFDPPIRMQEDDSVAITIRDDLTGLLQFNVAAVITTEVSDEKPDDRIIT